MGPKARQGTGRTDPAALTSPSSGPYYSLPEAAARFRRVHHRPMTVLVLGDGDFSFAASLLPLCLPVHADAEAGDERDEGEAGEAGDSGDSGEAGGEDCCTGLIELTATSYDTLHELEGKYGARRSGGVDGGGDAAGSSLLGQRLARLRAAGVEVAHGVDAMALSVNTLRRAGVPLHQVPLRGWDLIVFQVGGGREGGREGGRDPFVPSYAYACMNKAPPILHLFLIFISFFLLSSFLSWGRSTVALRSRRKGYVNIPTTVTLTH